MSKSMMFLALISPCCGPGGSYLQTERLEQAAQDQR